MNQLWFACRLAFLSPFLFIGKATSGNPGRPGSRSRGVGAACLALCVCFLSFALASCGSNANVSGSTLLTSDMTWGSSLVQTSWGGQTLTILTSSPINGTPLATSTYHINMACILESSSAPMSFTATASGTWFTVQPSVGSLPAFSSTTIGLYSINAATLPFGLNTGVVTISAPGYENNISMTVSLDCEQGANGSATCTLTPGC